MTKTERNRKDREFSLKVRARGKCEKCGSQRNLQAAHIFSRRYSLLRHNEINGICLCAGCHFWGHANPILFSLWVQEYLGPDKFQELLDLRNEV